MYPIMTTLGVWQRPKCGFLQGPKQFIITTVKTLNCDFPCDIFHVINIHRQLVGDIGNIEIGNIGWCIDVSYISVHQYYRALFGNEPYIWIFVISLQYIGWVLYLFPHLEEENIFASVLRLFLPGADFLSIINIFGFCPPPSTAPT